MRKLAGLLVLLAASGCGAAQQPPPPESGPILTNKIPRVVNIQLLNATIGPCKFGGTPWDGIGTISPTMAAGIARALDMANPYSAVTAALADPATQALAKPEVFGEATLYVAGVSTVKVALVSPDRDSFTPSFPNTSGLLNVSVTPDTSITVRLIDKDAVFNDPMGDFTIRASDILAAAAEGKVHQVSVASQTNNQILFFGILVLPVSY